MFCMQKSSKRKKMPLTASFFVAYSPLTHKHLVGTILLYLSGGVQVIRKKVGERIKELRQAQNISQEKLALKADIDRTYLASVEQGKRNIAIINLEKIVIALDTTLEVFFKGL